MIERALSVIIHVQKYSFYIKDVRNLVSCHLGSFTFVRYINTTPVFTRSGTVSDLRMSPRRTQRSST